MHYWTPVRCRTSPQSVAEPKAKLTAVDVPTLRRDATSIFMNLLDLLFPKTCLGCGRWGSYICSSCQNSLKFLSFLKCPVCCQPAVDGITHPGCRSRYALDGLYSFFPYNGTVKQAIKAIKYRFASSVSDDLIFCIPQVSINSFQTIFNYQFSILNSILVPIPLHWSRRFWRGFNQAEVIASLLSKRLQIPVDSSILYRRRRTIPQVAVKNREERLKNMKNVFCLAKPDLTLRDSLIIILIDDVFTTGATLREAGHALKRAGVKAVWGLTIAQ